MHPNKKQVLPVMPEAIQNQDGTEKQDCESNTAKHFIANLKKSHPLQGFTICGDGLMSHQPMIETIKENGMHYLLVAKPGEHKYLFKWVNDFSELPSLEVIDDKSCTHQYRWENSVPLHGEDHAATVNFLKYHLINQKGKNTKNIVIKALIILIKDYLSFYHLNVVP